VPAAQKPSTQKSATHEPATQKAATQKSATQKAARSRRKPRDAAPDRGLRDIVGAGHSQLGVSGALRGRDVNRPTEQDLAEAEQEIVIVRRHWKARDEA
jgi:predicted flap endonuclease-1-like 5' DNA nuclease